MTLTRQETREAPTVSVQVGDATFQVHPAVARHIEALRNETSRQHEFAITRYNQAQQLAHELESFDCQRRIVL